MHEGVGAAERRPPAPRELDVAESADVAMATHAAARSKRRGHGKYPSRGRLAGAKFRGGSRGRTRRMAVRRAATWRTGCVTAVAWVALPLGVVAWRLAGSTYRSDIEAICEGEVVAGLSMREDMARVTERVRAGLRTSEGNRFFASLRDVAIDRRGQRLRAESAAVRIASCPMAEAYEQLAIEAQYRGEMQRLCSYVTFPGLVDQESAARLRLLEAWIDETAVNERTRDVAARLRGVRTLSDGASVLRQAAREVDVFTCDIAKVVETPRITSCSLP
jgi:hypothetical protein